MKRILAIALTAMMLLTLTSALAGETNYKIGIGQFAVHGSLDNCRIWALPPPSPTNLLITSMI